MRSFAASRFAHLIPQSTVATARDLIRGSLAYFQAVHSAAFALIWIGHRRNEVLAMAAMPTDQYHWLQHALVVDLFRRPRYPGIFFIHGFMMLRITMSVNRRYLICYLNEFALTDVPGCSYPAINNSGLE